MGFINVFVGSEVYANIERNQLKLTKQDSNDFVTYPLEDLNSVLFDNNRGVISFNTLSKLTSFNIITYFCDEKHLPVAYLLPFNSYFKELNVYKKQVDIKKPVLKNIWRNIVKQKIKNQAECLRLLKIDNNLNTYIDMVQSGDSTNIEGVVANKYFKLLFDYDFNRRDESNFVNGALNYGYAIIRGAISRTIVAHGLQPFLGIHHINQLNNFNLVDDIIEPFRPVVDLYVRQNLAKFDCELGHTGKLELLNLLNYDVKINNQVQSLNYAIEIMVESYIKCLNNQDSNLSMPDILQLKVHEYE